MFLIPHLGTLIWTTLIFSLLLYILAKYAWKPLLKALDERQSRIENALKSAEEARLKVSRLEEDQQKIILEARLEKGKLIKEGVEQAERIIAEAHTKALAQTDQMIEETRNRIRVEREAALLEMKNQIASLSVEIATKVIKAELEERKRHEKLVQELIKEVDLN